jgi:hypothetical protein
MQGVSRTFIDPAFQSDNSSLGEQGAEHVAINVFSLATAAAIPRSFARSFRSLPSHHSLRTLRTYPEPPETQLPTSHRPDSPLSLTSASEVPCSRRLGVLVTAKSGHQSIRRNPAAMHTIAHITLGTVWSHREPAARESSPAHPRSCVPADQKAPSALPTLYILSTALLP